ncbi:MAG: hypothetical protein QM733_07545 [Ilumatobacteraceae bacterium]
MPAAVDGHGAEAGRRFYERFGERFHVELGIADGADRVAVCADALTAAGLPAGLIDAAGDTSWDERLRAITAEALQPVGLDVSVPVLHLDGLAASGPVLSSIPSGRDAVDLFDALRTMTRLPGLVRFERARRGSLLVDWRARFGGWRARFGG